MKNLLKIFLCIILILFTSACNSTSKNNSENDLEKRRQEYESSLNLLAQEHNAIVFDNETAEDLFSAEICEMYSNQNILLDHYDVLDVFLKDDVLYADIGQYWINNDSYMFRLKITKEQFQYLKNNKDVDKRIIFSFEDCKPVEPTISSHINLRLYYEFDNGTDDYDLYEELFLNKKMVYGTLTNIIAVENN